MQRRLSLTIALLMLGCPSDDTAADGESGGSGSSGTSAGPSSTTEPPTTSISGSTGPTSTESTSTGPTGDPSSTTGPECVEDTDCRNTLVPFCIDGECEACSSAPVPDDACAAFGDGTTPICFNDTCVQCTARNQDFCEGTTPLCDFAPGVCVGCTFHEECPDSACHIDQGSCFPDDSLLYVDGDAADCLGADGTEPLPFCTIGEALALITGGQSGVVIIAERAAAQPYLEALDIDNGRIIALLGTGRPILTAAGAATLTVTAGASTAYLQDLRIDGNANDLAMLVDTAATYIDRTEVVQNSGGGITLVNGALLQARNTVIGFNGNQFSDTYGINASGNAIIDILFSTIAANDGNSGFASVSCEVGSGGEVRNSVVAGVAASSIRCDGANFNDTAVDTMGLNGVGITDLPAFDAGWFVDVGLGDFHLTGSGQTEFTDVAVYRLGDPDVDLDGDARPTAVGGFDFGGADEP